MQQQADNIFFLIVFFNFFRGVRLFIHAANNTSKVRLEWHRFPTWCTLRRGVVLALHSELIYYKTTYTGTTFPLFPLNSSTSASIDASRNTPANTPWPADDSMFVTCRPNPLSVITIKTHGVCK